MHLQRLVGFSPNKLYAVVKDIHSYPKWIPAISKVTSKPPLYTLHLNRPFPLSFTSKVSLGNEIRAELNDGPFEKLSVVWKFDQMLNLPLSMVNLTIHVKPGLLTAFLPATMPTVAPLLISAFRTRCIELYGKEAHPKDFLSLAQSAEQQARIKKLVAAFEKQ
jgi:ribosome-associated toxin RatA of RatAB toxin-antitoxin module